MHRLYKFLFLLSTSFSVGFAFGQQDPIIYQFSNNPVFLNPATASANGLASFNSFYNFLSPQLTDFVTGEKLANRALGVSASVQVTSMSSGDTAPQYGSLSISYMNSKVGYEKNDYTRLGFNKVIRVHQTGRLRIGAELQDQKKFIAFTKLRPIDSALPQADMSDRVLSINLGICYYNRDWHSFYLGLSATHVTNDKFEYEAPSRGTLTLRNSRHFYVISGFKFQNIFKINHLDFKPDLMLLAIEKSGKLAKPVTSLQTVFSYKEQVELGILLITPFTPEPRLFNAAFVAGLYPLKLLKVQSVSILRIGYTIVPYFTNPLFSGFRSKRYTHELSLSFALRKY